MFQFDQLIKSFKFIFKEDFNKIVDYLLIDKNIF